jgi:tRNA(Ile)-lysidine synthase
MGGFDPSDGVTPGTEAMPVSDAEAATLFASLKSYKLVVLAVSGGADSTSLMHLVARWLALSAGGVVPRVVVATVDHGLRASSGAEAHWVAEQAKALGFSHATLLWEGEKRATGIQDAARRARYDLLAAHAGRETPAAVVTAHTQDDQAETLLMRLARGSGLDGLAGMPSRRGLTGDGSVDLVRPLLAIPKVRLIATLEAAGQPWIEDPSNEVLAFERVRLRKARAALEELGLTNDRLALSAGRLGRAREALATAADDFRQVHVALHDGIYASFARDALHSAPREVRIRVLSSLLEAFGGEGGVARLAQVEVLEESIDASGDVVRTLGGCLVSAGRKLIRVFREPAGRDLPQIELAPGHDAVWDRRFEISLGADAREQVARLSPPLVVRALGGPAYATLRARLHCRLPARPVASLPALWSGADVVGVPDLIWPQAGLTHETRVAPLISFRAKFVGGGALRDPKSDPVGPREPK